MPSGKLKGCGIGSGYMQKFLKRFPVSDLQYLYDDYGIGGIAALFPLDGFTRPSDDSVRRVIKRMGVKMRMPGEHQK